MNETLKELDMHPRFETYYIPKTGERGVMDMGENDVKLKVDGLFDSDTEKRNYCETLAESMTRAMQTSQTKPVAWRKALDPQYDYSDRYRYRDDTGIGAAEGWEPLYRNTPSLQVDNLIRGEIKRLRNHLHQRSEQITRLQNGIEKLQQGSLERNTCELSSRLDPPALGQPRPHQQGCAQEEARLDGADRWYMLDCTCSTAKKRAQQPLPESVDADFIRQYAKDVREALSPEKYFVDQRQEMIRLLNWLEDFLPEYSKERNTP